MSRQGSFLVYNVEGGPDICYDCPKDEKKRADYVVHHNISPASEEDKEAFTGIINKGMEKFLCIVCFDIGWRKNPTRYLQGQADFTFVSVIDWKKLSYQYR